MSCIRSDPSRCARLRSGCSVCGRCTAACPTGAISVEESIQIDEPLCVECGCCTAVCPTDALQCPPPLSFGRILASAGRRTQPILGCERSTSTPRLDAGSCLGWLTEEHMCALATVVETGIQLDLTNCGNCHGKHLPAILQDRMDSAARRSGLPVHHKIRIVTDPAGRWHNSNGVDRRQFLTLWKELAAPEPDGFPNVDFRAHVHRDKVLPSRCKIAIWTANQCAADVRKQMAGHFRGRLTILDHCEGCLACVAVCPNGALRERDAELKPEFLPLRCTDCGACEAFCSENAIRLSSTNTVASECS